MNSVPSRTGELRTGRSLRKRSTPVLRAIALVLVSLAAGAACSSDSTGPGPTPQRVVLTSRGAGGPALIVQSLDGTDRQRIHFDGVEDDILGNLPEFLLPIRDETIIALGPVRWSPDGSRFAVILSAAFDQSQVVIMEADGTGARTVSPNTQVILSNVAWSPDGTKIAYAMSTIPGAGGVELFTTDLTTNTVRQVPTGVPLGGPGVALAWDADGSGIFFSRITGTGDVPLFERITRIERVDLQTGKLATLDFDVPGEAFGIAAGGDWVLLVRRTAADPTGFREQVVRRSLVDRQETVLTAVDEVLAWASITAGDQSILVTAPLPANADALLYTLIPAAGGESRSLDTIDTSTSSADISVSR